MSLPLIVLIFGSLWSKSAVEFCKGVPRKVAAERVTGLIEIARLARSQSLELKTDARVVPHEVEIGSLREAERRRAIAANHLASGVQS
jgi:hypothetical protein